MYRERLFAIAVAVAFFLFPYAGVKDVPPFVAWIGIFGAILIGALTFVPVDAKYFWPISLIIVGVVCSAAGSLWLYQRIQEAPQSVNVIRETEPPSHLAGSVFKEQQVELPFQIEFGDGEKYERIEQVLETGIFRRLIYVSVFNQSADDISDCNIKLIAATPRPKTGDNLTNFPVFFGANFDLRGKQRKFIQIVRFAENPGNGMELEHDNIIISAAVGGFFPGWTTIPIPSIDDPAILTLEAVAPSIASRTAHLRIWVTERRIHAKIA